LAEEPVVEQLLYKSNLLLPIMRLRDKRLRVRRLKLTRMRFAWVMVVLVGCQQVMMIGSLLWMVFVSEIQEQQMKLSSCT